MKTIINEVVYSVLFLRPTRPRYHPPRGGCGSLGSRKAPCAPHVLYRRCRGVGQPTTTPKGAVAAEGREAGTVHADYRLQNLLKRFRRYCLTHAMSRTIIGPCSRSACFRGMLPCTMPRKTRALKERESLEENAFRGAKLRHGVAALDVAIDERCHAGAAGGLARS